MRVAPRLLATLLAATPVLGVALGPVDPAAASDPRGAFEVSETPLPPAGPDAPVVALTFDDGPHPDVTPKVLEILRARGVKATFFVLGSQAEKYPDLVRQIMAEGHVVSNHTYKHPRLTSLDDAGFAAEVDRTQDIIEDITGVRPSCLRPPYGASDPTTVARLTARGLTPVFWTADSTDFEKPGTDKVVQRSLLGLGNGSIILMHDAGGDRAQTLAALPQVIDQVKARGFSFTPICQPDAHIPKGGVDPTTGLRGRVHVTGWAKDPDTDAPVTVKVLVDGTEVGTDVADGDRPDLAELDLPTTHGFDVVVRAPEGAHEVCVRAVNLDAGTSDASVGCVGAQIQSPVPFSVVEAVQRVRYVQVQRAVVQANPVLRVRQAFAALWTARLFGG